MPDGLEQNDLGNSEDFVKNINGEAETVEPIVAPEKIGELFLQAFGSQVTHC